jgi:LysM repeat protein
MTMPNPLVPEGSQLEQKSKARSRVKLAVFFVLSIHVVGLMGLLLLGCRPEQQNVPDEIVPPDFSQIEPIQPIQPPLVDTNPPVLQPPVTNLPGEPEGQDPLYANLNPAQPPVVVPEEPAVVTPEPAARTYTIQKGDTYYSIGREFGVSMQALIDANPGVEPTRLQLGQTINIPPASAPAAEPATTTAPGGGQVYTVVSGDTLSKIAQKHGTTWQAIMELNNLPTTSIKVGDKLRIPAPEPAQGGQPSNGF